MVHGLLFFNPCSYRVHRQRSHRTRLLTQVRASQNHLPSRHNCRGVISPVCQFYFREWLDGEEGDDFVVLSVSSF